jgi:hypothetical protein
LSLWNPVVLLIYANSKVKIFKSTKRSN